MTQQIKSKGGNNMGELELFTVSYKNNGAIGIEFNEQLLVLATKEELFNEMEGGMDDLAPIVSKMLKFIKEKANS